jgi:hypothetical protein
LTQAIAALPEFLIGTPVVSSSFKQIESGNGRIIDR